MPRQLVAKAIQVDQISLEHCDWYSQDAAAGESTGALKLPRGNTNERPATNTGGRENIEIQLTVSQPDVPSSDPNFLQMDPWMWAWEGNYNRNALTSTTVTSGNAVPGLTLFRGSKYRFKNNTVGHNLWLRSAEKTSSSQPNNYAALTAADGVTNNGAIKAQASDPAVEVEWVIPSNYAANVVYVQHNQTGMVNTIAIHNPPDETLGYMRLNTDIGHDAATKTGLEVYTGTGWKTIPFEDNAGGTKTHPTGTLLTDDNGSVANAVVSTEDAGLITTSSTTGDEDFAELLVTAFLPSGDLSVNSDNTIVLHDGATGGGIPMLRADMSNAPIKKTNKTIQYFRQTAGVNYQQTNVIGSVASRISWNEVEAGHDVFTLEDSSHRLRVTGNINTNTWFKIMFDGYTNTNQMFLAFRRNGVTTHTRWCTTSSAHHSFTVFMELSFNDTLEIHVSTQGTTNTAHMSDKHMLIELVGS